jgi:mRNA interferase RelE/StbE
MTSHKKWSLSFFHTYVRQYEKLDKSTQRKITTYLEQLIHLDDPRSKGKALAASYKGYWRYRVGDYRVICKVINTDLIILAVKIGHRKNVYTGDFS